MIRAGISEMQSEGYRAFIPINLPPEPDIEYDDELRSLLCKAERNLARLDGITTVLPNPDLFIAMYVPSKPSSNNTPCTTPQSVPPFPAFPRQ